MFPFCWFVFVCLKAYPSHQFHKHSYATFRVILLIEKLRMNVYEIYNPLVQNTPEWPDRGF